MSTIINARQRFLEEYRDIRRAEGRGSEHSAYYQALPYRDLSGRNRAMWRMRAKTYQFFANEILLPLERTERLPLHILDLGAGNCWMSYRLSVRHHRPVAVDIFTDERDGLGAARHYPTPFPLVQAEFDCLPFPDSSFDLAIFNSSLHYSTDYVQTLAEVRRCLRPRGTLAILDTPVYKRREDGLRMVEERHAGFLQRYGFRSDAIPSIEFLDEPALAQLSETLGLRWEIRRPWYGWQWRLRPYKAWLLRRRPPSRFWVLAGRFQHP